MTNAILIDTNVVLDFAMVREEFFAPADRIMIEIAEGRLFGCITASQVTDIYYFLEKEFSHEKAVEEITKLMDSVHVIGVDRKTIEAAIGSQMLDFEDAVQASAAKDYGIDIVITRDKAGFLDSGLIIYSPEEFVKTF